MYIWHTSWIFVCDSNNKMFASKFFRLSTIQCHKQLNRYVTLSARTLSCHPVRLKHVHVSKDIHGGSGVVARVVGRYRQWDIVCRHKSHYENWAFLEYDDLVALIESGDVHLIDVRDAKEVAEQGEFPGAINIPLPEVKKALQLSDEEYKEKYQCGKPEKTDTNLVFASFQSIKSSAALEIAHKLGFTKSRQYVNGYEEWKSKLSNQTESIDGT